MRHFASAVVVLAMTAVAPAGGMSAGDAFLSEIRSHFAAWDADHDGKLSFGEIDVACTDPAVKGDTAAAAATLRNVAKLRNLMPAEYATALADPSADGKPNGYVRAFEANQKTIAMLKRDLFAAPPEPDMLGQGRLGDCFLLAGLGTLCHADPARLQKMITATPGGNTHVAFGNGQTVVLPAPTEAEACIGAHTRNNGLWANAFEKAVGARFMAHAKTDKYKTPFAIIGVGGTPNTVLTMITGHKCVRVGCEDFQKPGKLDGDVRTKRLDAVRDALEQAFKDGRLIVGGTGDINAGETVVPGLFYDHSYGVFGYDRKTDVVTFWNPMGGAFKPKGDPGLKYGYPTSYGQFQCPLADTVLWFGSFSIETTEPVDPAPGKVASNG